MIIIKNLQNCELCSPVDHRVKLKQREKKYKYLDLARDLQKLWNMKVTVIRVVIGALCKLTKGLIQGFGGLRNKKTNGDHC